MIYIINMSTKKFKLPAIIAYLLLAAMFGKVVASASGTPDTRWYTKKRNATEFTISNADELAGLAKIVNGTWGGRPARDNFSGKTVTLASDIDLSTYDNWTPIGDYATNTANVFSGTFNGGGHVISNLKINRPGVSYQGFFGYIDGGNVKNLRFDSGRWYVGNSRNFVPFAGNDISATSTEGTGEKLLLTAIITDSVITIGAKGGFMPSIFYKEFHRYITADGLDTLVEYNQGGPAPRHRNGRELTVREREGVYLYVADSENRRLSAYDELRNRLIMIKERYTNADDADNIIIAAENDVIVDKIVQIMNVARGAGFPNVSFAILRDGTSEDEGPPSPIIGAPQMNGGRSRASVQRVVVQNMNVLGDAYSSRLRNRPGLTGKVVVDFSIDEFGAVVSAQVKESTMNDPKFELQVVDIVKTWRFEKIDKPGDITKITYPFVFSE
jgi:TonB family protein